MQICAESRPVQIKMYGSIVQQTQLFSVSAMLELGLHALAAIGKFDTVVIRLVRNDC